MGKGTKINSVSKEIRTWPYSSKKVGKALLNDWADKVEKLEMALKKHCMVCPLCGAGMIVDCEYDICKNPSVVASDESKE